MKYSVLGLYKTIRKCCNYHLLITYICISLLPAYALEAKEVYIKHDGLILNAELEVSDGKAIADGVILLTHGGLAHRDMESLRYLRSLLIGEGHNLLSINLSLGIDNRHGMYDCNNPHLHRNNDALDEIGLWIDWLSKKGVRDLILMGHSRGGAQTALFAAERDSVLIKKVVLLAPATRDNGFNGYENRYKKPLKPMLTKVQEMIDDGLGDEFIDSTNIMFCRKTKATANSFASYYLPDPRLDTPYLIPFIKKPTLVIVAADDQVVKNLGNKLLQLEKNNNFHMTVIDSADHLFRDLNMDEAVEVIDTFLQKANG